MERRRDLRIDLKLPVQVTLLGEAEVGIPAVSINISEGGIRLLVDRRLPIGSPVKVEADDALYLAEVCHCAAAESGYEIGLEIVHTLVGLRDLHRLNSRLMEGAGAPGPASVEDQDTARAGHQERDFREHEPVRR